MEKRLILALLLSLGVIFIWGQYFAPKPQPRPTPSAASSETVKTTPTEEEKTVSKTTPNSISDDSPFPRVAGDKEEEFVLETAQHRVVFSNRGAQIRELRLKHYYPQSRLTEEEKSKIENWLPLLVDSKNKYGSLFIHDPYQKLGPDFEKLLWKGSLLADGQGIEFTLSAGNGVTLRKRIVFPKDSFHAEITLELENKNPQSTGSDWILEFSPTASIYHDAFDAKQFYPHPMLATGYQKMGGDYEVQTFLPVGQTPSAENPFHSFPAATSNQSTIAFVGDYNKYFAALARPMGGTKIEYSKGELGFDGIRTGISFHVPAPGKVEKKEFLLYLGPKDPNILRNEKVHPEYVPFAALLQSDLGFFGWIARFLLWILKGFWNLTRNYGIAIILLTLLVRAALFPISRKQQISMGTFQRKIAKIAPQLEVLKKKYKDQKQKMYEEQMKLYREHGITTPPLMGCLPILLQIPVFFGLFSALQVAFDIRQAPFLWVNDLSRPDALIVFSKTYDLWLLDIASFNILPIMMVVVWIWQQRTMPKPADPQQAQMQKMMSWFPLVFGFMLYNYAAGLSIYMIVSSLCGVYEQKLIRKHLPPPVLPTPAPTPAT